MSNQAEAANTRCLRQTEEQLSTLINRINKKLKGWRPALKYLYDNDDIIDEVLKEINHFIKQLKKFNGTEQLIAELEELIY